MEFFLTLEGIVSVVGSIIGIIGIIQYYQTKRNAKDVDINRSALGDREYVFSLKKEDRIFLFEEWKLLEAKYDPPLLTPIPIEKQLDNKHPIEFERINSLFEFLEMKDFELKTPLTIKDFKIIYYKRKEAIQLTYNKIQRVLDNIDNKNQNVLLNLLDSIYDYLSEEDQLIKKADIALVPGYRSTFRAKKAGELYREGKVRKIYLTGNKPYYDQSNIRYLSEALAMEIYLTDIEFSGLVENKNIYIDTKAEDTKENVELSRRPFLIEKNAIGKPLDVVIVTSPYHMRRTFMLVQKLSEQNPDLISNIVRICSLAKFMKNDWFKSVDGVKSYLTAYWKLHGGRVVGEF